MSALTNIARVQLAQFLHDATLHMGWGTGNVNWDTDKEITAPFNVLSNQLSTGYQFISEVSVRLASDPDTEYVLNTDFTVNASTGVVTRITGGSIPSGQNVVVSFHVLTAPETVTADALLDEVGRRIISSKSFVVPDSDGEIIVESGSFSLSEDNAPTNHLLLEVAFQPSEASDKIIREIGVFSGTVPIDGLPGGQQYFLPAQIDDAGKLIAISHLAKITRNATSRETFRMVITL